jgi:hypothetical protein
MTAEPPAGPPPGPQAGPPPGPPVTLPADRAFLVQFRAWAAGPCAGRVEHLASGRAARFGDWAGLRQFVDRVLREAEHPRPGDTDIPPDQS